MAMKLFTEDVFLNVDVKSDSDVLSFMARHLLKEGKVKKGYEEHLLAREFDYPTGLYLGEINVAIPHTDYQYANTTQVAIATLNNPVLWRSMEDPDETLSVSVVVLSIFDHPEHQLKVLQQIMGVLQNQECVAEITKATTPQQVISAFEKKER